MQGLFVIGLLLLIGYLVKNNKGSGLIVICKLFVWGIIKNMLQVAATIVNIVGNL